MAHIDYFAYTTPTPHILHPDREVAIAQCIHYLEEHLAGAYSVITGNKGFTIEPSTGAYRYRLRFSATQVCVSWGTMNEHMYIEAQGQGCNELRLLGALDILVRLGKETASRIDIARDYLTKVRPDTFAASCYSKAFKSRSRRVEVSGHTEYIGSYHSERFARVYRYNPPHERSDFLRVEFVSKGDYAKKVTQFYLANGIDAALDKVAAPFRFTHPLWASEEHDTTKLNLRAYRHANSSSTHWIISVVTPSIVKAHRTGELDAERWFSDHVLPKIRGS